MVGEEKEAASPLARALERSMRAAVGANAAVTAMTAESVRTAEAPNAPLAGNAD